MNVLINSIQVPKYCCTSTRDKYKKLYNCPNCGAPITGPRCEYCGTHFKTEKSPYYITNISYGQLYNLVTQINQSQNNIAQSIQNSLNFLDFTFINLQQRQLDVFFNQRSSFLS